MGQRFAPGPPRLGRCGDSEVHQKAYQVLKKGKDKNILAMLKLPKGAKIWDNHVRPLQHPNWVLDK